VLSNTDAVARLVSRMDARYPSINLALAVVEHDGAASSHSNYQAHKAPNGRKRRISKTSELPSTSSFVGAQELWRRYWRTEHVEDRLGVLVQTVSEFYNWTGRDAPAWARLVPAVSSTRPGTEAVWMPSWEPATAELRARIAARASAADLSALGQGKQTPASLREVIVDMVRSGEASQADVAEAVGVEARTIRRWREWADWTCPHDAGNDG
jgi:hypothetical protein